MKKLRKIHTLLGVFFAPLLLYYLSSGAMQLLGLEAGFSGIQTFVGFKKNEDSEKQKLFNNKIKEDAEMQKVKKLLQEIQVEIEGKTKPLKQRKQKLQLRESKRYTELRKQFYGNKPTKDAKENGMITSLRSSSQKFAKNYTKAHYALIGKVKAHTLATANYARFAFAMIAGVVATTLLGLLLAFKYHRPRWQAYLAFVLGIILPILFF